MHPQGLRRSKSESRSTPQNIQSSVCVNRINHSLTHSLTHSHELFKLRPASPLYLSSNRITRSLSWVTALGRVCMMHFRSPCWPLCELRTPSQCSRASATDERSKCGKAQVGDKVELFVSSVHCRIWIFLKSDIYSVTNKGVNWYSIVRINGSTSVSPVPPPLKRQGDEIGLITQLV